MYQFALCWLVEQVVSYTREWSPFYKNCLVLLVGPHLAVKGKRDRLDTDEGKSILK